MLKGACGTEQGSRGALGLQNLSFCVGGDSEGRRRSRLSGINAVIGVTLRSLQLLLHYCHYRRVKPKSFKSKDYFWGGYIQFFCPCLEGQSGKLFPRSTKGALSKHFKQKLSACKATSAIRRGDTAEGRETEV